MAHKFEPALFSYKEKDLILYALGVGAAENPWDLKELNFVYEGASNFQVRGLQLTQPITCPVCLVWIVFPPFHSTVRWRYNLPT